MSYSVVFISDYAIVPRAKRVKDQESSRFFFSFLARATVLCLPQWAGKIRKITKMESLLFLDLPCPTVRYIGNNSPSAECFCVCVLPRCTCSDTTITKGEWRRLMIALTKAFYIHIECVCVCGIRPRLLILFACIHWRRVAFKAFL